jgi:AraC family transcriptional regulator
MTDTVSLIIAQHVLLRAGREKAHINDRSSLERLRNISLELFNVLSAALQDGSPDPAANRIGQTLTHRATAAVSAPHGAASHRPVPPGNPGLAGWQSARVMAYIDSHLDSTIYTKELAALARLSPYHFCRVFRETHGAPPHRYVMQKRVALARDLMLNTRRPLGQIAMDCGLADQAHFNKLFRRFMGESPGAWRRARLAERSACPTDAGPSDAVRT